MNCQDSRENNGVSNILISQSETSDTKESMNIRDIRQASRGTGRISIPDNVSETSFITNHDHTLDDLNIILQNIPNNENASSRNGLQHLEMLMGNFLNNEDLELVIKAIADNSIVENDESQNVQLEQGMLTNENKLKSNGRSIKFHPINSFIDNVDFVSRTAEGNHNNDVGLTASRFDTIDLTSDSDAVMVPIEQQSVIVTPRSILNNANETNTVTQAKKRKHVTFMDAEIPGKRQKLDTAGYKCTFCAKEFNRQTKLEAHMKTHKTVDMHQSAFQCSICCKRFTIEKTWKSHEQKCNLKRYECYLCKKRLKTNGYLLEHMSSTHTGLKPFRCSECPKCFVTKRGLSVHTNKDHKKGKTSGNQ